MPVLLVTAWLLLAQVTGTAALSLDLCCPPAAADAHACCEGMSAGICPMHQASSSATAGAAAPDDAPTSCGRGCGSHEALLGLVLTSPGIISAAVALPRPGTTTLAALRLAPALRSRVSPPPAPPPWR